MPRKNPLFSLLLLACLLAACSSDEKDDDFENWKLDRMYSEAKGQLESGNYQRAIQIYQKLEARFPFSKYNRQVLLDTAYAQYKSEEPEQAVATADRFIKLYPQDPYQDYAWYLKGLANFNRGKGLTQRFLPTDESQRDPSGALKAFDDFAELLKRFPNSQYAEDSRQRMVYLRNTLARHEVHVANYYMRRGSYLAAANRARHVLENYPRTSATPEALILLTRAYKILELEDLYADAMRVLKQNYDEYPEVHEIESIVFEEFRRGARSVRNTRSRGRRRRRSGRCPGRMTSSPKCGCCPPLTAPTKSAAGSI